MYIVFIHHIKFIQSMYEMQHLKLVSWTTVVVHNRDHPEKFTKHSNIMHTKTHLGIQGLAQKASQIFFGNTSVQQNIVKNISNSFLDFQWLAETTHFSIFILLFILFILFSCFDGLQQNLEDILHLNLSRYA